MITGQDLKIKDVEINQVKIQLKNDKQQYESKVWQSINRLTHSILNFKVI